MPTGIYCISNIVNGRCYIGSAAVGIAKRWGQHKRALGRGNHHSYRLQADWPIYGASSFRFSILWECPSEVCLELEQLYIERLNPYYNISRVAGAPMAGRKHTQETRAKMSASQMGNKNCLGHHLTNETRAKLSAAGMGRHQSPESKAKMSASMLGHPVSLDTRAKIGASHKGLTPSPETRAKLSAAMIGNKHCLGHHPSPETRAKLSALDTGRHRTPQGRFVPLPRGYLRQ